MANLNLVTKIYAFFNAELLLRCNFSSITVMNLGGGEGQEPQSESNFFYNFHSAFGINYTKYLPVEYSPTGKSWIRH